MIADTVSKSASLRITQDTSAAQVILVIRQFPEEKLIPRRFSVVWKIQHMQKVRFLFLNNLPAEINNILEPERLVIFLPAIANQDWIRIWQGNELKL
jgi:hypothetical protein